MKNLKNVLFCFAALFFVAACQKDKTTSLIEGIVKNATGTGIDAVAIIAYTVDGIAMDTVSSTSDGSYEIECQRGGKLKFLKSGYLSTQETVADENKQTLDVTLLSDVFNSSYFTTAGNTVTDPVFVAGSIQPTISNFGTLTTGLDAWFSSTTYKGAVDPSGTPWYDGWSFYSRLVAGQASSAALPSRPTKTITGTWMDAAGDTVTWTKDTTYILEGFVFVNDGQLLNIQAGTMVQGKPGTGASASALIVARGGKIMAQGTAAEPIVFTYEGDAGGSLATLRGQWGGLILLGKAGLNSTPGSTQIEGIPTSEARGAFGGADDSDNSGILRYVSIRHGGSNIGADNEINGLTLGGVGSGTTIEYVEVVGNNDDGIEWFGGTVQAKYVISAFCADDAFDYDEGYRGKNQFFIAHQASDEGDRGGENDGGTNPETATPYATPWFVNCTFVGRSTSRTLTFRDNAGGYYHNSIFTGFGKGVDIEDLVGQSQDAYKQWQDGNLKIENNLFFNIAAGTSGPQLFTTAN